MSYKITNTDNYLEIEFIGNTSLEENELARQEVIAKLNRDGICEVLVNMTKADLSKVSFDDLIKFGEGWEDLLVASNTKFATLVPYKNPFRKKINISLWVGKLKGIQLKVFEERALAIQWLKIKGAAT